ALSADIIFLGKQPNVIAQGDQSFEQMLRIRCPSNHDIRVGEPETGRQEGAFARRQAVLGRGSIVAKNKPTTQQSSFDRCDRPVYTRIIGRQKADLRNKKRAGVQQIALIGLGECTELCVEGAAADFFVNLSAYPPPTLDRTGQSKHFDALDRAIECNPSHDLRMGEVTAFAAHLPIPNAVVRTTPYGLEMV